MKHALASPENAIVGLFSRPGFRLPHRSFALMEGLMVAIVFDAGLVAFVAAGLVWALA
jgi:hypothetical protein